jgi:hypothetical protein
MIDPPHRCDDTLQSSEQHGCRQMYHLIGMLGVSSSSLACAQECEERVLEIGFHQSGHSQVAVGQREVTSMRLGEILDSVTCQMNHIS